MKFKANIKGKEYPILFDILALKEFSKDKGFEDFSDMDKVFSGFSSGKMSWSQMDDFAKLAMYGIMSGCEDQEIKYDLTEKKIFKWLFDDLKNQTNLKLVMDAIHDFTQSITGDDPGEVKSQVLPSV